MVNNMLQLNAKNLKSFRDALAKWHIADFDSKDKKITKSVRIKALQGLITTNQTIIDKSKDVAEVQKRKAEIEAWEKQIVEETERVKKHVDALATNFEEGRKLITDELLKKFEEYLDKIYDDEVEKSLLEAIAQWFIANGAEGVVADDVRKYLRPLGRKGASARKSCETNRHTTREKGVKLKDAFLGALCDDEAVISLLPVYSWNNKIEKSSKKKEEKKSENKYTQTQ